MLSSYFTNGEISENIANNFIKHRNEYNYPNVRLRASKKPTKIKISDSLWAETDESKLDKPTDLELDEYHFSLLSSSDPDENLLGTSSVIFWGYYTFKRNYALNKLKWHLDGYRSKLATSTSTINQKILLIKNEPNNGLAMSHLSDISQLGSIPFASKVITFLRPETAGIYDNQIHKGLIGCDWYKKSLLNTRIGAVRYKNVQNGYDRWCSFLSQFATDLNNGITEGQNWRWHDSSGVISTWRAVDVERALFNYFKTEKNI